MSVPAIKRDSCPDVYDPDLIPPKSDRERVNLLLDELSRTYRRLRTVEAERDALRDEATSLRRYLGDV